MAVLIFYMLGSKFSLVHIKSRCVTYFSSNQLFKFIEIRLVLLHGVRDLKV